VSMVIGSPASTFLKSVGSDTFFRSDMVDPP
jgi:hypothetical protein